MAETNRVEARLLLRYATYNQWMSSSVILLPGEAAIAYFPQLSTLNATDNLPENTPPAIGIKIGDGYSYFYELPWVQAPAADVYNWAKQPTPPAANTIPGLSEYVAAAIENSGGGSGSGGGTSSISAYRIIYDSANSKYVLQAYDDTTQAWINTTSEINLSSILNRITGIENWANGAFTNIGNIDIPLLGYIQDEVVNYINQLDNNDEEIPHQFVTSVTQTNGLIAVTRSSISIGDLTGVLSTEHGGTGLTRVEDDELLIGSADGTIQPRQFVTHIEEDDRSVFATAGAIIDYVLEKTAGLTGAMHYIGEATVEINPNINPNVNPNITGYDFSKVRDGDVITYNYKEYVWAGGWRLLGDEGSYAVKGSITNNDIAENAYIAQYKIDGLEDTLNTRVNQLILNLTHKLI